MDENEARHWLDQQGVSRETQQKLRTYVDLLLAESQRQNLISAATRQDIYSRHIVDSVQLLAFAPNARSWLDLGSGAGLPGIVLATLTSQPVYLVESRRLRSDWLIQIADALGLGNVKIFASRLEAVDSFPAGAITARAFAPMPKLLPLAHRFSSKSTIWVLPKGKSAAEELALAKASWHGSFVMKPSVTSPDSAIVVATGVAPKYPGRLAR
jgi:16S rRNA (guanine527-N7)-methyltransferase